VVIPKGISKKQMLKYKYDYRYEDIGLKISNYDLQKASGVLKTLVGMPRSMKAYGRFGIDVSKKHTF